MHEDIWELNGARGRALLYFDTVIGKCILAVGRSHSFYGFEVDDDDLEALAQNIMDYLQDKEMKE